jgi:hypothetical protein
VKQLRRVDGLFRLDRPRDPPRLLRGRAKGAAVGTFGRVSAVVAAATTFFVFALGIAGAANPAAPDPDTAQMALAASDFAGASMYIDRHISPGPPVVSSYERAFQGIRLGSQRVFRMVTIVELLPDAETTNLGYAQFRSLVNTPSGRKLIAQKFTSAVLQGAGGRIKVKSVSIGPPAAINAGKGGFRIPILMKTSVGRLSSPLAAFYLDRGFGIDVFLGYPGRSVSGAVVERIVRLSVAHFQKSFTVKDAVIPSIGGVVRQGQTLTASPGVWSGAPAAFTYQWNRCTSAGTSCAVLPGATAPTYLVGTADSGSTLQVSVTGTNTVGSSSATSAVTTVVP